MIECIKYSSRNNGSAELEMCGMKTWIVEWNADKENHLRELNAWLVEEKFRLRIRVI